MRKYLITAVTFTLFSGIASADRRDNHRDERSTRDDRHDNGPYVRDHRYQGPQRGDRPAQRADRRVISRRAVYAHDGQFAFGNNTTRAYQRPILHRHYHNAWIRPLVVEENYAAEPGYIWVRGQWIWNGNEWLWGDGHYVPDPQYSNYYDDGSYDYSVNFSIGR